MHAAGTAVVAAAGNSAGHAVGLPANCPGVIAVAGLRHVGIQGRLLRPGPADRDQRAGRQLRQHRRRRALPVPDPHAAATAARSGRMPAARSGPTASTISVGTSFSAPIVAGTAALMLSARPQLQPAELRTPAAGQRAGLPDQRRRQRRKRPAGADVPRARRQRPAAVLLQRSASAAPACSTRRRPCSAAAGTAGAHRHASRRRRWSATPCA